MKNGYVISFGDILRAFRRQWRVFLLCVVVFSLVGGIAGLIYAEPLSAPAAGGAAPLQEADFSALPFDGGFYSACYRSLCAAYDSTYIFLQQVSEDHTLTDAQKDQLQAYSTALGTYYQEALYPLQERFASVAAAAYAPPAFFDELIGTYSARLDAVRDGLAAAEAAAAVVSAATPPPESDTAETAVYNAMVAQAAQYETLLNAQARYESVLTALRDRDQATLDSERMEDELDAAMQRQNALLEDINQFADALAKENHLDIRVAYSAENVAQVTIVHTHFAVTSKENFLVLTMFFAIIGVGAGVYFSLYREAKESGQRAYGREKGEGTGMELLDYAGAISNNIKTKGLKRYDPCDIDFYLARKNGVFSNDRSRKFWRAIDIFFPVVSRKLLRIQPTVYSTTYYHLGMAYLTCEKNHFPVALPDTAAGIADQAIAAYYDESTGLWHDSGYEVRMKQSWLLPKDGPKTMPMHCAARLDIFLLALWRETHIQRYLDIAVKAASAIADYHQITEYGPDKKGISYFYNTFEVTLNVNLEYVEWIADIPAERRSPELADLGHKILNMVLAEQRADGAFDYYSAECAEKYGFHQFIDTNHTAYMLKNFFCLLASDFTTEEEKERLLACCVNCFGYFFSVLCNDDTGVIIHTVGLPRKEPDPVSYGECITMMYYALRCDRLPDELRVRLRKVTPKLMRNMLALVNEKTGSAPSDCIYHKKTQLDSIRWGNGPVLQAIFDYMAAQREGLLEDETA